MIKSITVGGVCYNVAQAPADKQKDLMLLVAGVVAIRAQQTQVKEIDTDLLLGTLIMMPKDKFDQIAQIVLYKTIINGEKTPVDIKAFQGKMLNYTQLVAEAVAYNLDDFFIYLDDARNGALNRVESNLTS